MKKSELCNLLGWEPGRSMRLEILNQIKTTGKSIQEVASSYQLPEIFILDENNLIEDKGENITPAQFKERHPFKRFVTISTKK